MSEQSVIEKAQAAVGDHDTIVAAAWFEPRGTAAGVIGGGAAGSTIGHVLGGGLGGAIGDLAGAAIGYEAAKRTEDFGVGAAPDATVHQVPFRSILAVSDTHLYGWRVGHQGMHHVATDLLFAIPRTDVRVTVKERLSVHSFEVRDLRTGDTWEFESGRMESHLKYVLGCLHQVDAPAST